MSEEYKNMDYYQLYEYIEGLRIELEEAQASTEFQGKRADGLRKKLEESNTKLEYVLAKLYSRDCNSFEHVSVSLAIAHLCDEELDRSGALLGRVRDKAYALAEIEKVKDE